VLGRKTYEGLAGYWPNETGKWADMVNPIPKWVGSNSLSGELEWNATALEGELEDSVPKLKAEVDGDLFMHGSGEFAYALAEKGLIDKVAFVTVDVPGGEHRQPAFLAKNPSAAVPVLALEDGTHIAECTAITEYLDHLDGEPTLTGKTPKERAIIAMMQRRAEIGLMEAAAAYFHHATPGLGPQLETYQNREWGEKCRERVLAGMAYLDSALDRQPYLAGERFTVADITAFAGLVLADFVKVGVPAELERLQAWRARVAARPSIAHA